MSATPKVPKALLPKYESISALTGAFCDRFLNDEYRALIDKATAALSRKRPSPLLRGQEKVWAAAIVHAIGMTNFLFDSTQTPHCRAPDIHRFFEVGESSMQNKSKEIRQSLSMMRFGTPEWELPSRLDDNPWLWMVKINGILCDARLLMPEIQEQLYEMGMIPFVPDPPTDR